MASNENCVLILTRRLNQTLTIGDDITVTVLAIKGNQVRLGIGAPTSVGVHREEIYARIQPESPSVNKAEAETSKSAVPFRTKKSKLP